MLDKKIKLAVLGELGRIICFVIYYMFLFACGIAIFVSNGFLLWSLIADLPEMFNNGNLWAVLFLLWAAVMIIWGMAVLGVYLVKPFFSFQKNQKTTRVEVREPDAPELFAIIREVAQKTKCRMPKHVYLTPEVNACVFYNTNFWSIFFPVRKNLEIGLGLFDGTSVGEIKSVIAHEFGHFSQNSMRVGATVYVTHTILYNLICPEGSLDSGLDKSWFSDILTEHIFGVIPRWIRNPFKRLTLFVYRFVEKGYLKLSKYMEYDADNIACQAVGTGTCVSALCKSELLLNKDGIFQGFLRKLLDNKAVVSDFFSCKGIAYNMLSEKGIMPIKYDEPLKELPAQSPYEVPSRVKIEDVWSSHPSLGERVENMKMNVWCADDLSDTTSAWTLIPRSLAAQVSEKLIFLIKKQINRPVQSITDEQFEGWVRRDIETETETNTMDQRLSPFFGKRIHEFDVDSVGDAPAESPFTQANAIKIARLDTGINDWHLLNLIENKKIEVRDVKIDGTIYKRGNLPLGKMKIELDILYNEVVKTYSDIYAYLINGCDEERGLALRNAFLIFFYAQRVCDHISNLRAYLDDSLRDLDPENMGRRRKKALYAFFNEYEHHLKTLIPELSMDLVVGAVKVNEYLIAGFANPSDYVNMLKEYAATEYYYSRGSDVNTFNDAMRITDSLMSVHIAIYNDAKHAICNIAGDVLNTYKCYDIK